MLTKKLADAIVPSQHHDTRDQVAIAGDSSAAAAAKRAKQSRTESPTLQDDDAEMTCTKESFTPSNDLEKAAVVELFDPLPESISTSNLAFSKGLET